MPPGVCDVAARPDLTASCPSPNISFCTAAAYAGEPGIGRYDFDFCRSSTSLPAAFDRFEHRRLAGGVLIDADAEVDLLRIRIGAKRLGEAENWVAGAAWIASNMVMVVRWLSSVVLGLCRTGRSAVA